MANTLIGSCTKLNQEESLHWSKWFHSTYNACGCLVRHHATFDHRPVKASKQEVVQAECYCTLPMLIPVMIAPEVSLRQQTETGNLATMWAACDTPVHVFFHFFSFWFSSFLLIWVILVRWQHSLALTPAPTIKLIATIHMTNLATIQKKSIVNRSWEVETARWKMVFSPCSDNWRYTSQKLDTKN